MSLRTISVRLNDQNPARVGSVSYDNTINVKIDSAKNYNLSSVSVRSKDQNSARVGIVSYDNTINTKVDSAKDYKVKNATFGITKLQNLDDVYAVYPIDGDTLVFNAVTGKYTSQKLSSSKIDITNIDAGIF